MAKRKQLTDAEIAEMRDIEAYTHEYEKRSNNPPVGLASKDKEQESIKKYEFDPHIDPMLDWAGKTEGTSFTVPTSSIHIHESIKPHKIIKSVQKLQDDVDLYQGWLFEDPIQRMHRKNAAIEFYKHGVDWTNRLIVGDSLVVMNSLLEKEGMAGQVQMVYIDPPYGIKYGSNFQPFVNKKDVKDRKDEDLTQEPEMIKAFRDTWELGIHSYLSYLRDRLLLARDLLKDSGSVFIQISDENVHHVREICDEIFGAENFISNICAKTKLPLGNTYIGGCYDQIIWYAKDKSKTKYHKMWLPRDIVNNSEMAFVELPDGSRRHLTQDEKEDLKKLPSGSKVFQRMVLSSAGKTESCVFPFEFEGKEFWPIKNRSWKTNKEGMDNLKKKNRLFTLGDSLYYVMYYDDFPVMELPNMWPDTTGGFTETKKYVVQTAPKIIQRCILMTTDPGDLVFDPTCGSGTTAYLSEQWGRRWITCDTSRVAITLAKQRLMTATFDYYKLSHAEQGVSGGFIYNTVPHITLGAVANNEPTMNEILYDQPIIDNSKIRITGPFTLEALPAPTVKPLDDISSFVEDSTAKQTDWREQLLATGILGKNGMRLDFNRIEPISGTRYFQAEGETKEDKPRRAIICFAGETKPLDSRMVALALDEAESLRPAPELIIFAAFQFGPEASKELDETKWTGVTILKAQMNTDLMTLDLKKKKSSDQSFFLVGQPDVELIKDNRTNDKYKVKVNGFDYYNVKTGTVDSGDSSRIAMWELDTDYDGLCIEPVQVFFPIDGANNSWKKLAKTLNSEIDEDLIEKYAGNESLWFTAEEGTKIAIKIIDDRGIESLRVITIGE